VLQEGAFLSGIISRFPSYPKGYTHQTVLFLGDGVGQAVLAWGDVLLERSGKTRTLLDHPHDLSLTDLGYWTDNGAWYHYLCSECCEGAGAQNPCPCPPECAPGLSATFHPKLILNFPRESSYS